MSALGNERVGGRSKLQNVPWQVKMGGELPGPSPTGRGSPKGEIVSLFSSNFYLRIISAFDCWWNLRLSQV